MEAKKRTSAALSVMVVLIAARFAAGGGTPLTVESVVAGLTDPVFVTHAPGLFDRIFIVEQVGRIRLFNLETESLSTYLDLTDRVGAGGEKGLLGLAFHPDYINNGLLYVNYTRPGAAPFDTRISRFAAIGSPATATNADPATELIMMTYSQPFSNHNGGWIGFSPNDGALGYLYIATGDGGSANDPGDRAQDITSQRLGKMLRIDVDSGEPFTIPPTNPFVGVTGDDEIWAYGLRNPFRCAFDSETGDLYIGDVGQNTWEEVSFQPGSSTGGENYGWRCMEANHCFTASAGCTCNSALVVDPIHEYSHSGSRNCIIGGEVYRGCALPGLPQGTYFFAENGSEEIWSFRGPTVLEFTVRTPELNPGVMTGISSFGTDAYGEIYICSVGNDRVYRVISADPPVNDCNENGVEDACDIRDGSEPDADENGVPDACECATPIDGDVNNDGTVDVFDILCVLDGFSGVFTTCLLEDVDLVPCPAHDAVVDIFDILAVLDAFAGDPPCCGA